MLIKNEGGTINTEENKSELLSLYKNEIKATGDFECESPIQAIEAKYTFLYKFYYVLEGGTGLSLEFDGSGEIASFSASAEPQLAIIEVTSDLNSLTFTANGKQRTINPLTNTKHKIKFKVNGGTLYISNYIVTVNVGSITTYTKNGKSSCADDNDCLRGFMCSGGSCKECDYSCSTCKNTKNDCSYCNTLTEGNSEGRGNYLDNTATCKIDYVDMTQFNEVEINDIPAPMTNRVTLGVWVFIKNLSDMKNGQTANIFHFRVKNFFVISVTASQNGPIVYCTVYEKYNPNIAGQIRADGFEGFIQKGPFERIQVVDNKNPDKMNGHWFHVQCGMSFDDSEYYLNVVVNGQDHNNGQGNNPKKSLPKELLYNSKGGIYEDTTYFYHIYKTQDKQTLQITNMNKLGTKVYLRNLVLFQEYMLYNIHYMYHDMTTILQGGIDFPEPILALPFYDLKENGNKYTLPYYLKGKPQNTLTLTPKTGFNFEPPLNFKQLPLLGKNKVFEKVDLTKEKQLSDPIKIFFKENSIMTCIGQFYLNGNCENECPSKKYIVYPGIAEATPTQGYCRYQCSNSMSCNYNKDDSFCQGSGNMNLFYSCVNEEQWDYPMYYSSMYESGDIKITTAVLDKDPLRSYFIEVWFYPDYTVNFKAVGSQESKVYVFYSNAIKIYYMQDKSYHLESDVKDVIITNMSPYEWNKFLISVKYNIKTQKYALEAMINNNINLKTTDNNIYDLGQSENQQFQYISFCGTKSVNCNNVAWGSGLYKDLKIWDGDEAQIYTSVQFDQYFNSLEPRISSLIAHFPLTTRYFKHNVITDINSIVNKKVDLSDTYTRAKDFRLWNYAKNIDYIPFAFSALKRFVNSDTLGTGDCPDNCARCWDVRKCYQCEKGAFLTLEQKCEKTGTVYFKVPREDNTNQNKIKLKILPNGKKNKITITFWTKVFGFGKAEKYVVQSFSANAPNLSLKYNEDQTKDDFGLNLITENPSDTFATISDFRDYFGKWVFFSIAYFYDSSSQHFPKMMKFEMNDRSLPLNYKKVKDSTFSIDSFEISNKLFALFDSVKVYNEYIVGAVYFEMNPTPPKNNDKFVVPTYETVLLVGGQSLCYGQNDFTSNEDTTKIKCVLDNDLNFKGKLSTIKQYYDFNTRTTSSCDSNICANFCHGEDKKQCSCLVNNLNSQMFFENDGANYCQMFKYHNFARAKKISIDKIKTAKETKKYTMHFWIFAYSYTSDTFEGVKFIWNGHNKIEISKKTAGGYEFDCVPAYTLDGSEDEKVKMDVKMNEWTFVSCAVDLTVDKKMYMNVYDFDTKSFTDQNKAITNTNPTNILQGAQTTLTIEDKTSTNDWGVLFYKEIRLWTEAYMSADFLSRIKIETASLFPYLIHAWNPTYKLNDNTVTDIKEGVVFTIEHQETLGMNVVKEDVYNKDPFLCSEQGEYYDYVTETCLQFTDLSKMEDLKFTNLPVSYSGSYSMAFWLFVEDSSTLTAGLNVNWSKHVQISVVYKNTLLEAYCFPQGYYADEVSNSQINSKFDSNLSRESLSPVGKQGEWIWIMCSVSNYNQRFRLNDKEGYFNNETMYKSTDNSKGSSSYPLRYFMSKEGMTSTLLIENIKNTKKVYLRELLLFKDYIPYEYSFKYMDLSKVEAGTFPSLLFACNFADFDITTHKISYYINTATGTKSKNEITATSSEAVWTFELSANFIFLPLCDPLSKMRYDATKKQCTTITQCDLAKLNARYCMEEMTPLTCLDNFYLNIDNSGSDTKITCDNKCPQNTIRSPGTTSTQGICNVNCQDNENGVADCPYQGSAQLTNYPTTYKCASGYERINYRCVDTSSTGVDIQNTALFVSRCYQPPNIYQTLSNGAKNSFSSGYLYEFWFKREHVNCKTLEGFKNYYLFSRPHSIYLNPTNGLFYYEVIDNEVYKGTLQGISEFEWNRIIIETSLGTTQGVKVYINFNYVEGSPAYSVTGIPASIGMQLRSISFCSEETNGKCDDAIGVSKIKWGSAFYRNIRVWDLKSSSIEVVQDYVNGMYTENLKSLILFYPLTIDKIDSNVLKEIISGQDNIVAKHDSTNNFYSTDNYLFYNYATDFDWIPLSGEKKYVSATDSDGVLSLGDCNNNCKRCYSASTIKNCYECESGYVLIGQECVLADKTFLKTPVGAVNMKVSFNMGTDFPKAFTITFYMKFYGVSRQSTSSQPAIFTLNSDTYLAYEVSSTNLILMNNNKVAFRDTNFNKYFGKWIPITISNYLSEENTVYPHMLTLSVDKIDIPFYGDYSIPTSGISVTELSLGYEVVALFAQLKVYKTFKQGAFGHIQAEEVKADEDSYATFKLAGTGPDNCLDSGILASGDAKDLSYTCVNDYNIYLDEQRSCKNNNKYFDGSKGYSTTTTCYDCDDTCNTMCFDSGKESCTCDMSKNIFWLRKHKTTKKTYCEKIPYINFGALEEWVYTEGPVSKTLESTVEFWLFVYSYNTGTNNFAGITVEWDKHNKIEITNTKNSLSAKCYAVYDMDSPDSYKDQTATSPLTFFKWNLVRCGTDLASETKEFFLNSVSKTYTDVNTPSREAEFSKIKIYSPSGRKLNFGFVFLRELKFWQQYNFKYIDTSYIDLISYTKFPGLLSYFKNTYDGSGDHVVKNELIVGDKPQCIDTIPVASTDFKGYNLVDPTNGNYYVELTLCAEGFVWNSATSSCVTPAVTQCEYPSDISDNCATCKENEKFITSTGTCASNCPIGYYNNENINQCRKCHSTCYTCTGRLDNECTSCTKDRYLVTKLSQCVENCEKYGETKSTLVPNMCVAFEAGAKLVNINEVDHIDIRNFNEIEATVFQVSSNTYTTEWGFDREETIKLNQDKYPGWEPPSRDPFTGDKTKLKTDVDQTFWELNRVYRIYIDVIKDNNGEKVFARIPFTITMNETPKEGALSVVPKVGLYNTTTFVIRCGDWKDDTTDQLQYRITSMEENTSTEQELSPWSGIFEIYRNFTVIYYQLPSSKINIKCQIKDNYEAVEEVSATITISNSLDGGVYSLEDALDGYTMPDKVTSAMLLARSEYLKSLGLDTYKSLQPETLQTHYEPSLDQTLLTKTDPTCTSDFCNSNGDCDLVDEFLVCDCDLGHVGSNCQVAKTGYAKLEAAYFEIYQKLFTELQNSIDYDQFSTIHNIYFSAQHFFQDPSFFSNNLDTYLTLAMNLFQNSILNNTLEYLDLFDYYYSYELMRLNQAKALNKKNTGYPFRNVTLSKDEMKEYKEAFDYISDKLNTFLKYLVNIYKNQQKTIKYESSNFFVGLALVNPTFSDENFFADRVTNYKSSVSFMKCLNYIEIEKLSNPYYSAWMVYIEYYNFPYAYNQTLSANHTSPLIELKFIDATTGKDIIISGCDGDNAIVFNLPFSSYRWIDELNRQKWLFDPDEYKSPDDPVFRDPIYINGSGYISNDTIEERIELYNRLHNFSCEYYDTTYKDFNSTGMAYLNFTSDSNYIVFNSTHLSKFTTFFIENHMTFSVQNRFFYLSRPQIFKYFPNYTSNYAFFVFLILVGLYLMLCFVLTCYDSKYSSQETLLDFIKVEIVKVFLPYNKEKDKEIGKLIPNGFSAGFNNDFMFNYQKKRKQKAQGEKYLNKIEDYDEKAKDNVLNLNKNYLAGEGSEKSEDGENKADLTQNEPDASMEDYNTPAAEKKGKGRFFNMVVDKPTLKGKKLKNPFMAATVQTEDSPKQKMKGKDSFDPNNMPEKFENEELERQKELEAYTNLNLTFWEFVSENMKNRHLFLNPLLNVSLFNPRWKKMTVLLTQLSFFMIMISVQLTADEKAKFSENGGAIFKIIILTLLASDVVMYVFPLFFSATHNQRKRLYKLVTSGGQLIVLKEWESMESKVKCKTFLGFILSLGVWGFSFYISLGFVAVWSVQSKEWLITLIICVLLEYVVIEFLFELIIGGLYSKRRTSIPMRKAGEFLNRVRNYRGMSP